MTEWQPIETAPKDGSSILLVWIEPDDVLEPEICVGWWRGEWRDHGDIGCCGCTEYAPTHWMPLPPPPQR